MSVPRKSPAASEGTPENDGHAPRHLNLAENIALTLKVLAGMGLIGAVLWAANLWTAAR